MGSEHYCLRWNNHQSNLLGVFSQLLQDESLVDVTLACSEGAPIRAHKVVLSACSSYFQSLFLDHPERHPIVILKDVRFTELQTLVEFMYKGEVNVQYCQLSALLKTAESLKVKGLAEMTNQNTTLREPEREPDRLRPHSQPSKSACDSPVDAALTAGGSSSASSANSANATALASSASNTAASTSASASASAAENSIHSTASTAASSTGLHKREPSDRGNTPPPTKRQQTAHDDEDDTPLPLDLYQRRIENEESLASTKTVIKTEAQARRSATPSVSGTSHAQNNGAEGRDTPALNSPTERPSPCSIGAVEKLEDDDYDEDMDLDDNDDNSSNELSNNFKRRAAAVGLLVSSPLGHSADIDSARSTPISASTSNATGLLPSDLTQRCSLARNANSGASTSTSTATGGMGAVGGLSPNTSSTITASSAVQSDTSGLGPVQSVPLHFYFLQSLKKEIDLSEDDNSNSRHHLQPTRSASAGGGLELDYRTTHDSMLRHFGSSLSLPATRSPTPFNFPFSPLGLNLFDLDPSRMLSLLHHQSWLAEEALRNRTLFTPPKESPHRINPLGDFYATHLHANAPASNDLPLHLPQQTPYKTNSFNVRYPSMAAFFQHQHQQEQQRKHARQNTASPSQQSSSATSTLTNNNNTAGSPICVSPFAKQNSTGCDLLLEELKRKSAANCDRDDDATEIIELSSPNSDVKNNNNNNNSNMMDHNKSHSFKNNMNVTNNALDQFLQQRRSASTSLLMGDNFRSYSQLFLSSSANTPSCTDTSSCKEKSSSSSTSSTPPPSAALLAQQQLSHILKSPSESSLFGDNIEEETRCVVCNAHFPNVWLLEQHAALQHPHIGPGDEKPFICEQCGQSYRYRSAYAKHKEQNHRARLPADKLFTCDVCGMQFRYLKSFKKHRLNHALERLHGKKGVLNSSGALKPASNASFGEQDVVTSTQEAMAADNCGVEDLRINIKREQEEEEAQRTREEEQDNTVDSAGMNMLYNAENSSNTASTSVTEATITSSDVIYSTNKKQRLLQSTHTEADASLHCLQQQASQTLQTPQTHLHPGVLNVAGHHMSVPVPVPVSVTMPTATMHHGHQASTSLSSLNSLSSITSLINAERLPNEQFLGLNPQEASILNFLRVDAAERQRDKRPQASRFACPFCGKCVRSKENLKLHVRKHTGERPFVCLFCGRAFGGKSDLTRHLRIHTGERPYHCESCGKCFARADYLSKHLTTHIHNAPR